MFCGKAMPCSALLCLSMVAPYLVSPSTGCHSCILFSAEWFSGVHIHAASLLANSDFSYYPPLAQIFCMDASPASLLLDG